MSELDRYYPFKKGDRVIIHSVSGGLYNKMTGTVKNPDLETLPWIIAEGWVRVEFDVPVNGCKNDIFLSTELEKVKED